ncbi:carbohydrate kinase [Pseudomonas sp. dw_358]|uniref:carbohydrate kinase family protein n=1 Tax=Pseudomonas sp. dw_358 TaxID=2720083 RepID=UPI001BD54707|nr:carbohydrate kinase [Pseudomonas sp. dw_358]
MQLPRVVVFGEALTDIVQGEPGHWQGYPGGAPWNVARGLSRLGVNSAFAGAISTDGLGDELARESAAAGLPEAFIQRVDADPLVAIVPSKFPPRYFFAGEADLRFDPARLPHGWLEAVELCHFSCISLAREPLGSVLLEQARQVRAAGKRISYDPNWRNLMSSHYREQMFPELVKLADEIKLSDEDLRQIYPGLTEQQALQALRELNPAALILFTRGEHGLVLYTLDAMYEQPAIKVEVLDTVGAGDASMAGWLASRFVGIEDYPQRLRFAAACASASCRRAGAYAASMDEVQQMLQA